MAAQPHAVRVVRIHPAWIGVVALLLLACVGLLLSLCACLSGGPAWALPVFLVTVWPAIAGTALVFIVGRGEPAGASGLAATIPRIRIVERPLTRVAQTVAAAWLIAGPTFFVSSVLPGGIEGGPVSATFETENQHAEPEPNIAAMLDAIESLGPAFSSIWSSCSLREFNIGYDCGLEPWAFNQGLSAGLLERMAAAGACLRLTLYPERRKAPAT